MAASQPPWRSAAAGSPDRPSVGTGTSPAFPSAGLAIAAVEGGQTRGIETGNGGFLDRETAEDGWQERQSYRDHVLKSDDLTDTRD